MLSSTCISLVENPTRCSCYAGLGPDSFKAVLTAQQRHTPADPNANPAIVIFAAQCFAFQDGHCGLLSCLLVANPTEHAIICVSRCSMSWSSCCSHCNSGSRQSQAVALWCDWSGCLHTTWTRLVLHLCAEACMSWLDWTCTVPAQALCLPCQSQCV